MVFWICQFPVLFGPNNLKLKTDKITRFVNLQQCFSSPCLICDVSQRHWLNSQIWQQHNCFMPETWSLGIYILPSIKGVLQCVQCCKSVRRKQCSLNFWTDWNPRKDVLSHLNEHWTWKLFWVTIYLKPDKIVSICVCRP